MKLRPCSYHCNGCWPTAAAPWARPTRTNSTSNHQLTNSTIDQSTNAHVNMFAALLCCRFASSETCNFAIMQSISSRMDGRIPTPSRTSSRAPPGVPGLARPPRGLPPTTPSGPPSVAKTPSNKPTQTKPLQARPTQWRCVGKTSQDHRFHHACQATLKQPMSWSPFVWRHCRVLSHIFGCTLSKLSMHS